MDMLIKGFSKLNRDDKLTALKSEGIINDDDIKNLNSQRVIQSRERIEELSENTISTYSLPYSVVPGFRINKTFYTIPLVTEESSIVAALAKSAKFWSTHGTIDSQVISTIKKGHIHFFYPGSYNKLISEYKKIEPQITSSFIFHEKSMRARGGGVQSLNIIDKTQQLDSYFVLEIQFETCDAMGANFINTILELVATELRTISNIDINMSILTNYNDECIVETIFKCPIDKLIHLGHNIDPNLYTKKFQQAINISRVNIDRAVTHNKGIMNGIDAVCIATGNDFRAIESCAHAYASSSGQYRGLSEFQVVNDEFIFSMKLPLSLGTVGGATSTHPLAQQSLKLLKNPNARELMQIIGSIGLLQNFAAVNALITEGIQAGHMRMHLDNIISMLGVTPDQGEAVRRYFKDKTVSVHDVREYVESHKTA